MSLDPELDADLFDDFRRAHLAALLFQRLSISVQLSGHLLLDTLYYWLFIWVRGLGDAGNSGNAVRYVLERRRPRIHRVPSAPELSIGAIEAILAH